MTPCNPEAPMPMCKTCERLSPGIQSDPSKRPRTLLIDASIFARNGTDCPMFEEAKVSNQPQR